MTRLLMLFLLAGCAEELTLDPSPDDPSDPDLDPDDPDAGPGWLRIVDEDTAAITVRIDATAHATWRYLDLDARAAVDIDDPIQDLGWHLGAARFNLKLNGGISGPGEVEAAWVPLARFDDPIAAPVDGWRSDAPGDGDASAPSYALGDWYDYDVTTHLLTPKLGVYVIRSPEQAWVFEVLSYYDDAGNSGFLTVRWRDL